jgi:DNA-binding transcriptional LysR family regulator
MSDYAARIVATTGCTSSRKGAGLDLAINQASRDMMQAQLEEGEVDLALGVFPRAGEEQTETLFPETFICLADKRSLPANGKLTLDTWLAKPHVQLGAKPDAVDEIEKALIARGLTRRVCVALPHWSAAVNLLVGTDLVLTIASRTVASEHVHEAICRFDRPADPRL